jgi:hypothetical protein
MNQEEILNMPAGQEMDALIAEKVFGNVYQFDQYDDWYLKCTGGETPLYKDRDNRVWLWNGDADESAVIFDPSACITAAWEVVEKIASEDSELSIHITGEYPGGGWRCVLGNAFVDYDVTAKTAPLAICRVALLSRGLTPLALDGGGLCACEEMSEHSVVAGVCVYCNRPRQ